MVGRLLMFTLASLLVAPLAQAQCVPVGGSNWPMLYSTIYYTVVDGNPTLQGLADGAANQWTGSIQANSNNYNNNAYANVAIRPGGSNVQVIFVAGSLPSGAFAETTRSGSSYNIYFPSTTLSQSPQFAQAVMNQEMGHVAGYDDVPGCSTETVMGAITPDSFTVFGPSDQTAVNNQYPPPDPNCNPTDCSPLILDLAEKGVPLTGPDVLFDLTGSGHPRVFGWTVTDTHDAFLVLDRNHNGSIDSGIELFGNFTPLSNTDVGPRAMNGFQALAWFDKIENGGNGDGQITAADSVFGQLRAWIDRNHNGVSEPDELFRLEDVGVVSISLTAKESRRQDEFGNLFKFRSEITVLRDGRTIQSHVYDVYLVTSR